MTSRARALTFGYLLALQFFYAWAWSSSDILRPYFRSFYGLTLAEAGSAYSAQVIGALAGALLTGGIEHRIGRRATLMLVTGGCGAALLAGGWVDDLAGLIAQRLVLGLFMGAVFPLTVGMVVDMFPARQRGRLSSLVDGTYFIAVIALGWASAAFLPGQWLLMFWPPALCLFALMLACLGIALPPAPDKAAARPPGAAALFARGLRARTLGLITMIMLNASGHQIFSGWLTTFMTETEHYGDAAIAATLTAQYGGSIAGCFLWGWAADHFGRRAGRFGLLASAVFVLLFLFLPGPLWVRQISAFLFGCAFATVVTLGPWLAELYPPHLRGPATSIFQWGRCASLVVPLASGALASAIGLGAVMALAAAAFAAAGVIWWILPETCHRLVPGRPVMTVC